MDGPPTAEEDFSALSIDERLAHKNWKARVSGYETLIKTFQTTASDNDPAFRPYLSNSDLLKKIATDSNAVAQEKGVECIMTFVKFAGEGAARTRDAVIPALVDKCLGSTRAGTRSQAIELALQYVEVENGGAGVVADILPGLTAKQPKVVAGCVTALKEIVRLFGTQVTPPPPVLKALPKIFGHSDKTVRAEGTALTRIMYQYIGVAIDPFLADLKPVQVKELREAFEEMDKEGKGRGALKPERLTRAHAREAEAAEAAGGNDEGDDVPAEDLPPPDPRSFAEEVDVVAKFPVGYDASLKSSKWKDRKEVLDGMLTVLQTSLRIKESPQLGDLAKTLATLIHKDANVACVMVGASCLEALAKGLGDPLGKYREAIVPPMLERLKERKATVTDAIGVALDAIFMTTSLADILGDLQPALGSKNPQVKEGTLKFLGRCLSTSPAPIPPPQIKPVSEQLASLMEDSFEGARNEAATCLGTLMKMVGERPLGAAMDGLADVRKAKVKEAFEKATVKAKAGSGGPPKAPVKAAAKAAPSSKAAPTKKAPPKSAAEDPEEAPLPASKPKASLIDEFAELNDPADEVKPARKPPARFTAKKPAEAATPAAAAPAAAPASKKPIPAAAASKGKAPPPPPPGTLDTFKYKHNPDDADALIADLIPPAIQKDLSDSNWKTRLAALEEMTSWVEGAVEELDSEVVVRFLAKKGWSEKNFQVSAKLYGILVILAEMCPSFGRSSAALCIPHLSEKLGDMKLKKPAGETLATFAEKSSLQFVLGHAYDPLSKQKAPKVLADALTWMDSALIEFGIAGLSLRSLIDFLKNALKNSNAAVRTSATKTLVTVKLFAGGSIKDLLEDLNPQLLNTITAEFDKVEGTPAPEPTRTSADLANMATSGPGAGKQAAGSGALDDLFPRVELDGLMKGTTILADSKSDAWKTKKEALETLQAIMDQGSNKRLKPNMGEIGQVLKARVTDTNKAVQSLALDIVSRIATGMGKPFEKHTRLFALPIATVLSDQKAPTRAAALQTLTAIATACEGLDTMVNDFGKALESPNPLQRASLLGWIADWFKEHELTPHLDLNGWVGPVVSFLDDRSGDVRKAAVAVLPVLIGSAGYDHVMHQTNSLKPASKKSAVPLIQAAQASAPSRISSKTAAKSVAKPAPPSSHPIEEEPEIVPATSTNKVAPPRKKAPLGIPRAPETRPETPDEGVRLRLPGAKPVLGGLKRPVASAQAMSRAPTSSPTTATAGFPFNGTNADAKRARLGKDAQRWINESGTTRKDLAELLQHQMEPHASKELVALLFSHDHNAVNDHVKGLGMIVDFYTDADSSAEDTRLICIANIDLPLKYVSIKAHEPQSNVIARCLDVIEAVLAFIRNADYQLSDPEAVCFIPTIIYKLGDAREQVRGRVQSIVQALPKVYPYSRVFQLLLDYGLKSKVAKTRQGSLDEMANILKRSGMGACDPPKALPQIGAMLSDKDPQVRKSALSALSEVYVLVGEKIWSLVGALSPKDKTQLEERLRRVAGPSSPERSESPALAAPIARVVSETSRPASPGMRTKIGGIPRSGAVASAVPRFGRPPSPSHAPRSASPALSTTGRSVSPARGGPTSPVTANRPKSYLPSRLGALKQRPAVLQTIEADRGYDEIINEEPPPQPTHRNGASQPYGSPPVGTQPGWEDAEDPGVEDMTIVISSILSSDPSRSVDALKKIQKVLEVGPNDGPSSPAYRELAEHTEGLVETITLQMGHVFDRPTEVVIPENFRLAKHLIQTLNAFCDHALLAESLTVDVLTSLLEELTLRLLETDDNADSKVKDLSRFINMIILRLFATARRMSIFRSLFALLLQIVKPFPSNGTTPETKEAKIAELVLKCIWKLARSMPQDLEKHALDPVELFPAIEHFLQSVPPNEWRARATNKVPCGDMPLRTIKVIIQHVVAYYGDDVYDLLSSSFDDPSATIVYPYVYRILNSSTRVGSDAPAKSNGGASQDGTRASSAASRPLSPHGTASSVASVDRGRMSPTHRTSQTSSSANGHPPGIFSPTAEEPDPDAQLIVIINHISSETTGALHKEGITELHHFLKAYPHKKSRVDKMLESTGPAFRKYITRALASRAAEDNERDAAVAHTLSKLEANGRGSSTPESPVPVASPELPQSPRSPTRPMAPEAPAVATQDKATQDRLSRLHDIFRYRSSTNSTSSSQGRAAPSTAT